MAGFLSQVLVRNGVHCLVGVLLLGHGCLGVVARGYDHVIDGAVHSLFSGSAGTCTSCIILLSAGS